MSKPFQARQDRHRLYTEWTAQYARPLLYWDLPNSQSFAWVRNRVADSRLSFSPIVATDPKIFAEAVRCKDLDKGQLKNVAFLKVPSGNLLPTTTVVISVFHYLNGSYVAVGLFC